VGVVPHATPKCVWRYVVYAPYCAIFEGSGLKKSTDGGDELSSSFVTKTTARIASSRRKLAFVLFVLVSAA
jgi:hypothetical protein